MGSSRQSTHFALPSLFIVLFGDTFISVVWSLAALASGLGFLWWHPDALGAGLAALGAVMTFLSLRKTRVIAGADGVAIRWLGVNRFIPYEDAVDMAAYGEFIDRKVQYKRSGQFPFNTIEKSRGVVIQHRRGETYLVCDDVIARDLIARVEERRLDYRRAKGADLTTIRRGNRAVGEWTASVRALLSQPTGYRGRATTPDELWSVLENPKSEPDERAAAAIALRSHLGEDARPRLRIAIESCASPQLRIALEAIDEDDEAKVGASLERLHPP